MASIHRRPDTKFYHAAWRTADGTLIFRSTKQTDRQKALAIALEFERAEKLATAGTLVEAQARSILDDILKRHGEAEGLRTHAIEDFLNEWMAGKEAVKSAATGIRYGKSIREFIAHLGPRARKPLTSLSPRMVESFITSRAKLGLAAATVALDAKVIRTALNKARRQGLIPTNPAEAIDLPTASHVERGTFMPGEIKLLLDAAQGEWRTLILLAYYTGQRLSDCVTMAWADVDLATGTWAITQRKTGAKLTVPLHPELLAHLETLAGVDTAAKHVMPGMADKGPGGRHGLSESFKNIMRKAGVDSQPVERSAGVRTLSRRSFHALRHSFTSALMNAGVAPELRMRLTGHKSDAMHGNYSHAEVETLRAAVAKLPALGMQL